MIEKSNLEKAQQCLDMIMMYTLDMNKHLPSEQSNVDSELFAVHDACIRLKHKIDEYKKQRLESVK